MQIFAQGCGQLRHRQVNFVREKQQDVVDDSIGHGKGPSRINYTPEAISEVLRTRRLKVAKLVQTAGEQVFRQGTD